MMSEKRRQTIDWITSVEFLADHRSKIRCFLVIRFYRMYNNNFIIMCQDIDVTKHLSIAECSSGKCLNLIGEIRIANRIISTTTADIR